MQRLDVARAVLMPIGAGRLDHHEHKSSLFLFARNFELNLVPSTTPGTIRWWTRVGHAERPQKSIVVFCFKNFFEYRLIPVYWVICCVFLRHIAR